ncbi:MAG: right-handed parallel beta-helix repeat-containing protein [Ferruginibacter sp.]
MFTFASTAFCKTYYIDALKGNDSNNGLSATTAWQTVSKVSRFSFKPGDIISFRAGQIFKGILNISSGGKPGMPVTYTSYGSGVQPVIDGNGDSTAVYCYNKEYINLQNIAICNFRQGEIKMNDLFNGIYIVNEDAAVLHHFHFDHIRVFNVNSSIIAKDEGKTDQSRFHGGVQFRTIGNKIRSNFDDVLITDCIFENLSRTGFNFRSDWDDRSAYSKFGDAIGKGLTDNWTPNTGVIFRKNHFKNIAANGLIVRVAVNALIEYNVFDSCGTKISGNAVFNFNTDNAVYQFNECMHTIYNEGDTDARGIDSDYRTKHTIIQYNYLHDNGLGGITATGGPGTGSDPVNFNIGTIIRYNIIENNARQGVYFSGRIMGLKMYNNIIYADTDYNDVIAIKLNRWVTFPDSAEFSNNIFYFKGKNISWAFTSSTNNVFEKNIYYGIKPPTEFNDPSAITQDPLLNLSGKGTIRYRLLKGSPALHAGVLIDKNAEHDYYGNKINKKEMINIGIDNGNPKK